MRGVRIALTIGQRYGQLVVIGAAGNLKRADGSKGSSLWELQCDCGNRTVALAGKVANGNTRSCGCLRRAVMALASRTHGKSRTGTYNTWKEMIARCERPTATGYDRYGGRGIRVCARWRAAFSAFLEDMGERPRGTTIERRNNDGNYEPGNCHWATRTEQNRNKSTTLSEGQVEAIRGMQVRGVRGVEIARSLDLSVGTVSNVMIGRTYGSGQYRPTPRRTLTDAELRAILARAKRGESQTSIANRLGVTLNVINDVVRGRKYVARVDNLKPPG